MVGMPNRYNNENNRIRYFRVPAWHDAEVSIGDGVTGPGRLQFHPDVEIRLITRGVARVQLGESQHSAAAGWLTVIPPWQLHAVAADGDNGLSFFALRIRPALLERLKDSAPPVAALRAAHGSIPADPELSSTVVAAHRALANGTPGPDAQPMLGRAVSDLVSWATRVEIASADRPIQRARSVDSALAHLRAHYTQDIGLDDLAAAAGLSKFHFLRLFAARVGVTPHRYQLLLRVLHAKSLLRDGLEIAEVALRTGFFDQSHLTRCFHELVGVTPGRYQFDLAPNGAKSGDALARNGVQESRHEVCGK